MKYLMMALLFLCGNAAHATRCADGTYSSSTGRGTCSWHGGIAGGSTYNGSTSVQSPTPSNHKEYGYHNHKYFLTPTEKAYCDIGEIELQAINEFNNELYRDLEVHTDEQLNRIWLAGMAHARTVKSKLIERRCHNSNTMYYIDDMSIVAQLKTDKTIWAWWANVGPAKWTNYALHNILP